MPVSILHNWYKTAQHSARLTWTTLTCSDCKKTANRVHMQVKSGAEPNSLFLTSCVAVRSVMTKLQSRIVLLDWAFQLVCEDIKWR